MAGALTGVTSINGNVLVPMNEDVTNKSLAIGTGADFKYSYSSVTTIYKNAIAIGNGAYAGGNGSLAIGFDSNGNAAVAGGVGSISLNAMANGDHNVIISGRQMLMIVSLSVMEQGQIILMLYQLVTVVWRG